MSQSTDDASIEISQLSNGVRVVTDVMPGLASAALGVWVGAGARHERADQNGVAHFLEHMAFKGTSRRTALQIAEEIEDVGGELNAYTSRETTAYYARVLTEDAGLAFDILADILRDPLFAEEDLALERGVILQEIGQSRDTPDDIVWDWAQEAAFPDQPIGRAILGPAENVSRFGRPALSDFMTERYVPERLVIAAAGAVDHAAIVRYAQENFGDLVSGSALETQPALYRGGEHREAKDLEQAHMVLGFKAPDFRDEAYFTAQVHAAALGGGMSSRLFQEVREKRGLCYAIFAQASHYEDTGLLSIYAGCGGEDLEELLLVTADQMRALADGATEAETARARAQLRAGLLMSLESPAARAERAARSVLSHGRVRGVQEVLDRLDAVDAAALRAYAGQALAAAPPTLTLYGPVDGAPALERVQARLAA